MAKFCGNCGSPLNSTSVFCGGCGTRVPAAPPAPAMVTPQPPAQPPAYVPQPSNPPPTSESAGFASIPETFPTAAAPAAEAFTSVPPTFTPTPVAELQSGDYAPVQGDFAAVPAAPTFVPSNFSPPPPPPAPQPAPQGGNFAPVQTAMPAAPPPAQAYVPAQAAYTPPQPGYAPGYAAVAASPVAAAAYAPGTAYPTAGGKKSNTLLKVIVALVLLLFIGGALALAGLWYAAQKIKEKAHAAAAHALAGDATGGLGEMLGGIASLKADGDTDKFKGDPCRFLSNTEVSQAVGVVVIRSEAQDAGCSYIAHGDPADMTAKHMASMAGGMGADAKTQKQFEKIAGGFFGQQEANDKDLRAEAATGEVPVLGITFTSGNAEAEMKMNRGAFTHLSGGGGTVATTASGDLDGIGDEAYVAAGGMLLVRKGNLVAHFMYIGCPCNTDNIKPLAKLVASRL